MKHPRQVRPSIVATVLLFGVVGGVAYSQNKPSTLTPAEQKQFSELAPEEQKHIKQLSIEDQQRILLSMVNMTPEERKTQATFAEMEKCLSIKDLDQRFVAIGNFVKSHPVFLNQDNSAFNLAYSMRDYIKDNHNHPELLNSKLSVVDTAFSSSMDFGRSLYEAQIAKFLLADSAALEYAESQGLSSLHLLHENDYVKSQKDLHAEREQYEKRDKLYVPEEFSPTDAKADFDRELSARYAILGEIQKKLGKDDAASDSFKHSLQFHSDMNAYVGLSSLEEAKGEKAAALENLYDADLTGHLGKADIAHMKQMYAELHPGSTEQSLESLLDEKYRSQFHSTINLTPYTGGTTSHRAVLAELFTGAGCEPCMSPDLAFDAALRRYTRDEMVLLVYHDNAPVEDPLANNVTEERAKYYSTGGSTPHAFLDGQEIGLVQGPPTHAQVAFDAITKSSDKSLAVPAGANIHVHAKRHGSKVTVTVNGSIAQPAADMLLHIDLLETQVSYSGENTLRLQPMVVRATAQQKANGSGFDVSNRTSFHLKYAFDLKKITAANFVYYSQYDAALKKRTHGMFSAKYREYANTMNPDKLAVVAFVQNNSTKAVLQAAYAQVSSHFGSTTNSEEQ